MAKGKTVFWTNKKIHLRVLDKIVGRDGRDHFLVCKADCPNPQMGQFSVPAEDVVSI